MSRKSDSTSFHFVFAALIFVMVMASVTFFLPFLKLRFMPVVQLIVGMLSSTYAQSSILHDNGCKNLKLILKLIGGKSCPMAKEKATHPKRTLLQVVLLVMLALLCLVDIGEAREMIDNVNVEEVGMQVSFLFI